MEFFKNLERNLHELNGFEHKSFGNVEYYNKTGCSLATEQGVLKYIVLDHNYNGLLPYGITWTQKNSNIVRRFGEPDKKISSQALGIEITYVEMGISIEFCSSNWEDRNNPIKSIVLFKGTVENPFGYLINCNLCSFCHLQADRVCSACKLIYYCNRECQIAHWRIHKAQCLVYSNGKK